MKNTLTIIKKELARVFKDPKLVFFTIIMPGLMIFALYTLMGAAIQSQFNDTDVEVYKVATVNEVSDFKESMNSMLQEGQKIEFESITSDNIEVYKNKVRDGECDLVIIFPENMIQKIEEDALDSIITSPQQIDAVYNNGSTSSSIMFQNANIYISSLQNKYATSIWGNTTIASLVPTICINEEKEVSKLFAMMLPMLIITFLFSGVMGVAPESIAGEKERGTIATLLVTPIKRREIAFGKIISLTIISLASATSSFIGIILSLPKLMGMNETNGITNIYSFSDYLVVFVTLISCVLLLVSVVSILSAFAKNIKEATTLILPLQFVSMGLGVVTMFSSSAKQDTYIYFIPIYNVLEILVSIFTFELNVTNLLITVCTNIVVTGICVYLLAKMFNNEKVMFSK